MDWLSGWCRSTKRLDAMTAIVTGCNTGIGKETVLDFYQRGARVIMACRDINKANEAAKDIELQCMNKQNVGELCVDKLDLTKLSSVRDFVAKIMPREEKIHILVNNAGVMMHPKALTEDGFEMHMATNHFGPALLTLLLLPKLRNATPSRVIFVSSVLHEAHPVNFDDIAYEKTRYSSLDAYGRSKSANILYASVLNSKLKEHNIQGIHMYSLHPGVIRTEIGRHFSSSIYGGTWLFNKIMAIFIKSPKCGAQTTIYCAVDEACANETGLYYSDCAVKTPSLHCQDEQRAAKLWEVTMQHLELENYNPFT